VEFRAFITAIVLGSTFTGCRLIAADETRILTKAADIARFPSIDPEKQPLVRFEGVATFVDPTGTVFLQDETGATFIRASERGKSMRPGRRLAVAGRRYPGLFIGGIVPDEITVLGEAPLPEPRKVTPDDLATARYHYQLVEIEGVGRAIEMTGETTATLQLNVQDKILEVRFDQAPENRDALIDAKLRVRGLAAGAINDRRQLVLPYVRLADGQSLGIVEPAPPDPFADPVVPLATLLDAAATKPSPHRLKIRGVALSGIIGRGFFLREDERSIFVQTSETEALRPGDEVDVLGFAQMGVFSAMLSDAVFRVTGHAEIPAPLVADRKMLAVGACDGQLIRLEARVTQSLPSENALLAQAGGGEVKVLSPNGAIPAFEPGSLARFTGLCRVTAITHEGYRAAPSAFEILLRSPGDAELLAAAPWWNARRLALGLVLAAGIAVLAIAWIGLLRRQVAKQLRQIHMQAQIEAVSEERQRIAREFHDTLEQELAGLTLRLDATATRVTDEKARGLLEQQRRLLSRLQTETRDFVWDLRDPSRQDVPLAGALKALLDHLQPGACSPLRLRCEQPVPPLPPLVQHHLLRIAREALNNAIKYARASGIDVTVDIGSESLRLVVADDGDGFEVAAADALSGHFGIRGMKERARKIGADLQIASAPGKGTRVELTLPLPKSKV